MKILMMVIALLSVTLYQANTLVLHAPTNNSTTLLRGDSGIYGSPRGADKKHAGVDIVANQSSADRSTYSVFAIHDGKIAYAQINGAENKGYGYTVVVDHGDGNYSLYAHLSFKPSEKLVKLGGKVKAGQLIGYLADLAAGDRSTGNVDSDEVKEWDKIQLHLECFNNKSGISSTAGLAVFHKDGFLLDPTTELKTFGYNSF